LEEPALFNNLTNRRTGDSSGGRGGDFPRRGSLADGEVSTRKNRGRRQPRAKKKEAQSSPGKIESAAPIHAEKKRKESGLVRRATSSKEKRGGKEAVITFTVLVWRGRRNIRPQKRNEKSLFKGRKEGATVYHNRGEGEKPPSVTTT